MNAAADSNAPVALVTGAAQRIGAAIARHLHANGYRVLIHCHRSQTAAEQLAAELNAQRPDTAAVLSADLASVSAIEQLATQAEARWQRIDLLVNNASSFYPTPLGTATEAQWNDLFASNVKAPFFLSQALAPALTKQQGSIVNLIDVHALKPLAQHPVYGSAKAGLAYLTRSLALELAPAVRVNGIAPGAILWPTDSTPEIEQQRLARIPLARQGTPHDIADTVLFLARSPYITGQVLAVDGGASLR